MEELVKWVIENKELAICLAITLSISIRFGKIEIHKYITNNYGNAKGKNSGNQQRARGTNKSKNIQNTQNTQNTKKTQNTKNTQSAKNTQNTKNAQNTKNSATSNKNNQVYNKQNVELQNIKLYADGIKGKVDTHSFRKLIIHKFGIEVCLKNNTSALQKAKVKWCIYKNNTRVKDKAFNVEVGAHKTLRRDFYVQEQEFKKFDIGNYKYQFLINEQRVAEGTFEITDK